jgi:hypothetical protein
MPLAVVGIPKTIDNDITYVWVSFGYNTALEKAREVLDCAHAESKGVRNGIALVKLMGRYSGSLAAGATLASQEVNFTLVPEIPFELEGDMGLLACLKRRIQDRGHAVIVAAEGAGQELLAGADTGKDASGNVRLRDIGPFLKREVLRPQLHHSQRARQHGRQPALRPAGAQRRACRDGRKDRCGDGPLVQHVHSRSYSAGDLRKEAPAAGERSLGLGARGYRPAGPLRTVDTPPDFFADH